MGGSREVKALLVLRHEVTNVLERVVGFFIFPMAYEHLAIVNCLYTSKTEGYAQLIDMNIIKYSQTITNCAMTIYINRILEN